MDFVQAAAQLASNDNLVTLRKRLAKLTEDPGEQARVLLMAAKAHGLNSNTQHFHMILSRAGVLLPADEVCALLVLGYTKVEMTRPDWWSDQVNLHGPFENLSGLVKRLGQEGEVLLGGLERMDPFTRCVVEITLCAEGVMAEDRLSEPSRSAFFGLLLTMSFPERLSPLGEAIWGENWLVVLAEHVHELAWRVLSKPERFGVVWDRLSPRAAAQILSRGYWHEMVPAVALLESRIEALRPELEVCAELWLEHYGSDTVRFGGMGNLVTFLGLVRTGSVDSRYYRLMNVCNYRPSDMPLINEAIKALPLEVREARALVQPGYVDFLYIPHAPTEPVIAAFIQRILGWKRNESHTLVRGTDAVFATWGVVAAPALLEALDGTRAPFTSALIKALASLTLPEAADTFALYLDHKQTREAAVAGLVALDADVALAVIEEALGARKKDMRVGGALALSHMPASERQREMASTRLGKERSADVIELLSPLVA